MRWESVPSSCIRREGYVNYVAGCNWSVPKPCYERLKEGLCMDRSASGEWRSNLRRKHISSHAFDRLTVIAIVVGQTFACQFSFIGTDKRTEVPVAIHIYQYPYIRATGTPSTKTPQRSRHSKEDVWLRGLALAAHRHPETSRSLDYRISNPKDAQITQRPSPSSCTVL